MSKKLVPNRFFKENPLEDISSARATLFMMTDELSEIINKMICEDTEDELIKQDLEKLEEEKVKISNLKNGEEVIMQNGYEGCTCETYRILKSNGKIVSKTLLSKDSYDSLPMIIKKGEKLK